MTVDADGDDVYVGISKSNPDKWHIIKRRLRDGLVTDLAPAGYATHASTRNVDRPGCGLLTYEGTEAKVAESPTWAQFYREVVALRIDGSGEIRRIAHTHNSRNDYYSEKSCLPLTRRLPGRLVEQLGREQWAGFRLRCAHRVACGTLNRGPQYPINGPWDRVPKVE